MEAANLPYSLYSANAENLRYMAPHIESLYDLMLAVDADTVETSVILK